MSESENNFLIISDKKNINKETLKLMLSELISDKEEIECEIETTDEKINIFLQKCEDFFLKYSILLRKGERLFIEESFLNFRKNIQKYNLEKKECIKNIRNNLDFLKKLSFIDSKTQYKITEEINVIHSKTPKIDIETIYKLELEDTLFRFIEKRIHYIEKKN